MNTRKPRHRDDLDTVIQETLRARTKYEEPPRDTWKEIRSRLTGDAPTRRKFRMFWLAPALQAALILVFVFLQGVGPYSYTRKHVVEPTRVGPVSQSVNTEARQPAVRAVDSDMDLQLLKEHMKHSSVTPHRRSKAAAGVTKLPTANVLVRQTATRQTATEPESEPVPAMLKGNLDLNR